MLYTILRLFQFLSNAEVMYPWSSFKCKAVHVTGREISKEFMPHHRQWHYWHGKWFKSSFCLLLFHVCWNVYDSALLYSDRQISQISCHFLRRGINPAVCSLFLPKGLETSINIATTEGQNSPLCIHTPCLSFWGTTSSSHPFCDGYCTLRN